VSLTGQTAVLSNGSSDRGDQTVYSQIAVNVDHVVVGPVVPAAVEAWVVGGTTVGGSSTDAPGAGIPLSSDRRFFGNLSQLPGYPEGSYVLNALPLVDGSILSVDEGCLAFPETVDHVTASITLVENGRMKELPEAKYPAVSLESIQRVAS
jgi:hypothetical protein